MTDGRGMSAGPGRDEPNSLTLLRDSCLVRAAVGSGCESPPPTPDDQGKSPGHCGSPDRSVSARDWFVRDVSAHVTVTVADVTAADRDATIGRPRHQRAGHAGGLHGCAIVAVKGLSTLAAKTLMGVPGLPRGW